MMFPPGQHYTADKMAQFREEAITRRMRTRELPSRPAWTGYPPTPRFAMPWMRTKVDVVHETPAVVQPADASRSGAWVGPTSHH